MKRLAPLALMDLLSKAVLLLSRGSGDVKGDEYCGHREQEASGDGSLAEAQNLGTISAEIRYREFSQVQVPRLEELSRSRFGARSWLLSTTALTTAIDIFDSSSCNDLFAAPIV